MLLDSARHVAGCANKVLHHREIFLLADEIERAQGFPSDIGAGGKLEDRLTGSNRGTVRDEPAFDAAGNVGANLDLFVFSNCP